MKISLAIFILISLILCSTLHEVAGGSSPPSPPSVFCNKKCGERCALKGPNSRCMKYCLMCCGKCACVPSGTSGNLDQCPCYRDWKAPNGRPKCP